MGSKPRCPRFQGLCSVHWDGRCPAASSWCNDDSLFPGGRYPRVRTAPAQVGCTRLTSPAAPHTRALLNWGAGHLVFGNDAEPLKNENQCWDLLGGSVLGGRGGRFVQRPTVRVHQEKSSPRAGN